LKVAHEQTADEYVLEKLGLTEISRIVRGRPYVVVPGPGVDILVPAPLPR
jgi:hypothetical protein